MTENERVAEILRYLEYVRAGKRFYLPSLLAALHGEANVPPESVKREELVDMIRAEISLQIQPHRRWPERAYDLVLMCLDYGFTLHEMDVPTATWSRLCRRFMKDDVNMARAVTLERHSPIQRYHWIRRLYARLEAGRTDYRTLGLSPGLLCRRYQEVCQQLMEQAMSGRYQALAPLLNALCEDIPLNGAPRVDAAFLGLADVEFQALPEEMETRLMAVEEAEEVIQMVQWD